MNETYIPKGSGLAGLAEIGNIIDVNFSISVDSGKQFTILLNLTIAGFAQLDDAAAAIASGYQNWITPLTYTVEYPTSGMESFLLISWEKTMQKILEVQKLNSIYRPKDISLLIYLNRKALINPWDIETSINNIKVQVSSPSHN